MDCLTTRISLLDYLLSDCKLAQPSPIVLMEIYRMTNGDPCKDCGYAPKCSVKKRFELKKMHKNSGFKTGIGETNAELAKRLGISKRQASKMRKLEKNK